MSEPQSPPLTPTEQMRRIREAVLSVEQTSPQEARMMLTRQFNSLDALRKRLTELEGLMTVKAYPFVSHAPVVGALIVRWRTLWNWMSTKWYLLPILQQQNSFNASATHALRELVAEVEILSLSTRELQARLETIESKFDARPSSPEEA